MYTSKDFVPFLQRLEHTTWQYTYVFLIEIKPTQKYSISDFKIKECKLLNSTAITSSYEVVIHKEALAMEAFLVSFLLRYKGWLKFFF